MTTHGHNSPSPYLKEQSELYQRDQSALASISSMRFSPLAIVSGSGSTLTTAEGSTVLDLTGGLGAAGLGYAHPAVVTAVENAARTMAGVSILASTNEPAVCLAEELLEAFPSSRPRKVYLGHAGSDANTAVIRAVRKATGRRKILTFGGSYHGGLGEAQSISGLYIDAGLAADPDRISVPYPDRYRPEDVTGDASSTATDVLAATLALVADALSMNDVALVIVEPVSNDAGVLVPPDGFLGGLRELCTRHGTLLASDEVKVGLGRTGSLLAAAFDQVQPDILTLGKSLGGGLPLSAALLPAEVADAIPAGLLLTTVGNPIAAAAGRAALRTIREQRLWEPAAAVGSRLLQQLNELRSGHAGIGDVRGRGLTIGVELVTDRAAKSAAPDLAAAVTYRAFELGIAVGYCGPRSSVIEFTPPLILSEAEADRAVEVFDRAISDVEAGLVDPTVVARYGGW